MASFREDIRLPTQLAASPNKYKSFMIKQWLKSSFDSLRKFIKKRYLILLMCMIMNAFSYMIRTNINITIVAMVKDDNPDFNNGANISRNLTCQNNFSKTQRHTETSTKIIEDDYYDFRNIPPLVQSLMPKEKETNSVYNLRGMFDWSESLQGTIVGAYYYGYILTNFNGGQLAEWIGTKKLLIIAMITSSLLTLLLPAAAFFHPYLLITLRILTGLAQGVVTPALYQLLSYWTPRDELGVAFGLIPASGNFGAVVTMPICAFLSEYGWFGGWPSVFYVSGIIGILSLIPWWIFVYDLPDIHPSITENELKYVKANSMTSKSKKDSKRTWIPWCSIITSFKIWAITITRFCISWGNLFLMSKLPTYLSQVLQMPITYNSYVNASIYISLGGGFFFWGIIADWIERRQFLNRTVSRKLFQTIAMFGAAIFMALIPVFGCEIVPIIIMLNLSMISLGLTAGGDSIIIADVAPDYSGSIYGFTNSIASLPGFLAPLCVGLVLDQSNAKLMQQWSFLFWIGSAIYVFGAMIFLLFVNAKPESWGQQQPKSSPVAIISSNDILDNLKTEKTQTLTLQDNIDISIDTK